MNDDPDIEILVKDEAWLGIDGIEDICRTAACAALDGAGFGASCELALILTDDAEVAELNGQWRGKNQPTNVLSFPAADPAGPRPPVGPVLLGDVVFARQTVHREAEEQGKPVASHLSHLIVHGVLHLLRLDHEVEAEAEEMENLERVVLARLGIPDPYAPDRAGALDQP